MADVLYQRRVTLDWDDVTYEEAVCRFMTIIDKEQPLEARLWFSPLSGFHVECWLKRRVDVFCWRRRYRDDGRRLVHDMLRDSSRLVHDVLWSKKVVDGITFRRMLILSVGGHLSLTNPI